jgi:carbonic anhydrase
MVQTTDNAYSHDIEVSELRAPPSSAILPAVSGIDRLLENNRSHAARFETAETPRTPASGVAVVACMDARLQLDELLGLGPGDAHVIRNAGGVVTEDVIRSLLISQRLLGTREVMLIHHTDCGMLTFTDDDLSAHVAAETGVRPPFALGTFTDLDADVRESVARVRENPLLPNRGNVRGFVYDVHTGALREVSPGGGDLAAAPGARSP